MEFFGLIFITFASSAIALKVYLIGKQEAKKDYPRQTALDAARWFLAHTDGYLALSHQQVVYFVIDAYDAYGEESGRHLFNPDTFWNVGFPNQLDVHNFQSPFTPWQEEVMQEIAAKKVGTLHR